MDGRLEQKDGHWQLKFTRKLLHSPEEVWQALTDPKHLAVWFPSDIEGERVPGASLRFVFRNNEGPTIEGKMIAYEPYSVLEFEWGNEQLQFDLQPDEEGTLLIFQNTFDELGKAARDGAGWHICLDMLACDLNHEEPAWSHAERWKQVHKQYIERFGPEAATIGPPVSRAEYT